MFGRIKNIALHPVLALNDSTSGKIKGIGLTMEGIEQNPVLYELMTDNTWRNTPINLDDWLNRYIRNRYGSTNDKLKKAWNILKETVYNGQIIRDGAESIIVARPTFEGYRRWARTKLNYAPEDLLPAWDLFVEQIPACKQYDGFQYDLVDLTRQILANYALPVQQQIALAYKNNDRTKFKKYSTEFLELMDDLDKLLATRKDFLLGPWIADARNCGNTPAEKALYERNARNLLTLWGGANNRLHEYANRQWSGLISDFYKPRWEQFFTDINKNWEGFNQQAFDEKIKQWEWQWVNDRKDFPLEPTGKSTTVATELHKKYRNRIAPLTKIQPDIEYNY